MYVCIHPSIHPSILLFAYFFGGSTKIRDFTSKSLGETPVWTNQVTKSGKVTTRNSGIYVTVHGDRGMGQYLYLHVVHEHVHMWLCVWVQNMG